MPGDVNDDGKVTIADVTAVVNYFLGKTSDVFAMDAANVNGDSVIDISDAIEIVQMILK